VDNDATNVGSMFMSCAPSTAGSIERSTSVTVRGKRTHSTASSRAAKKKIENAVYGYIQAVRTLDRTQINTDRIAEALSIPVAQVNASLAALERRGVRIKKR
jgi:hypothetical protein